MLAGEERRSDIDLDALERDFASFIERFHVDSLQRDPDRADARRDDPHRGEARHPPAGVARAQRQGVRPGAARDRGARSDARTRSSVVGDFLARNVRDRLLRQADPQRWFYEGQKLKLRATRLDRGDRARDGRAAGAEAPGRLHRLARHRARDQPRRAAARARGARGGERRRQRDDRGDVDGELGPDRVRQSSAPCSASGSSSISLVADALARAPEAAVEQERGDSHHPAQHETLEPPRHASTCVAIFCYRRRATARAAGGAVQRRQRSHTPAIASTQAAAAAPSVRPTGAPTASARPIARTSARFTLNHTRTRRKNNLTRPTPRRT